MTSSTNVKQFRISEAKRTILIYAIVGIWVQAFYLFLFQESFALHCNAAVKRKDGGLLLWSYDKVCCTLYLIRIMCLFIRWIEEKIYVLNDAFPLLLCIWCFANYNFVTNATLLNYSPFSSKPVGIWIFKGTCLRGKPEGITVNCCIAKRTNKRY